MGKETEKLAKTLNIIFNIFMVLGFAFILYCIYVFISAQFMK